MVLADVHAGLADFFPHLNGALPPAVCQVAKRGAPKWRGYRTRQWDTRRPSTENPEDESTAKRYVVIDALA